jgi:apoptosis-inducing factor 2
MHVAVVGGGFCGATVAKELDSLPGLEVTLINKTSFFEYNPSAHKCITDVDYQKSIRVPFSEFLPHTTVITGEAKQIGKDHLKISSKDVSFDTLVIATGVDYPIYLENKKNVYKLTTSEEAIKIHDGLKGASDLLIVGGGYIGTEIAAEIATKRKDISVTLVHSHDRLLERGPSFVSQYAKHFLERRKVNILLEEKIIDHKKGLFFTNKDRTIDSDLAIWCTGTKADPWFLKDLGSDVLSKRQRIIVNEFLQLPKYPHIYAGGDITDIAEEKTARKAEIHAHIISKNVVCQKNKSNLKRYTSGVSPLVISLGDVYGISQFGPAVLAGFGHGVFKELIEWWTLEQIR